MEWVRDIFTINGYEVEACYTKENITEIFQPLLEHWEALYAKKKKRILVFIAAPPACGKSTLVAFLEKLAQNMGYDNVQGIGMDGFHYPNEYLDFHFVKGGLLRDVKGCPESFDYAKLKSYIIDSKTKDLAWPIYDRTLHNPKNDAMLVNKDIVLLEGNYLLLDEEPWRDLKQYCDYSIFLYGDEAMLEKRLIERKAKGTTMEEAIAFYKRSDQKNVQRVLTHRLKADCVLYLDAQGVYTKL